ncbi:MAG: N-acetylmuramoyl-L-alanine amidase [Actinomycetota bacterium]
MPRTRVSLRVICCATAVVVLSALNPAPARPSSALPEEGTRGPRLVEVPTTLARSELVADGGAARAPFEITHVGFSWRGADGSAVRYRTRSATGSWTKWRRATEAHDLEHGRRHYSGVISIPPAARVEVEEMARPGTWMGPISVDLLNTVDGPTRTVDVPRAQAGARGPRIVTRAEWGADESLKRTEGGCDRDFWRVQQLFVHHTAGINNDPNPEATMRGIYWYHTQRRGWCDVGYNFVIGPRGTIYEGRWARSYMPWEAHTGEDARGRGVVGAHVADFNSGSVGISLMGNFSSARISADTRESLVELLAWEASRHGLRPKGAHRYRNPDTGRTKRLKYISGHRDAGFTECPGGTLYSSLPRIRRQVAARVNSGRDASKVTLDADPDRTTYGETAVLSGVVSTKSGSALAGRTITIWSKEAGRRWRRAGRPTTGPDGSYSLQVAPEHTTKFIAVYRGDGATWAGQSRARRVRVEANVLLEVQGGMPDLFGAHHFPPETETVALSGSVTPPYTGERVTVRSLEVEDDGSETLLGKDRARLDGSSGYSYSFHPPDAGTTYRLIAWFSGDGNARSHSESVYVVID